MQHSIENLLGRSFESELKQIAAALPSDFSLELLKKLFDFNLKTRLIPPQIEQEVVRRQLEAAKNHSAKLERELIAQNDRKSAVEEKRTMAQLDSDVKLPYLPEMLYSYKANTNELHWAALNTGSQGIKQLHSFKFRYYCSICEIPNGSVMVTGGGNSHSPWSTVADVLSINTKTLKVSGKPSMITNRYGHSSIYSRDYLYVIGGCNDNKLHKCERFHISKNRWEGLPDCPSPISDIGVVIIEPTNLLFVLGDKEGFFFDFSKRSLDRIHELNLSTLHWRCLPINLPIKQQNIPCFKLSNESQSFYFVQSNSLYLFEKEVIHKVKTLPRGITSRFGTSHLSRGMLYCSSDDGEVLKINIS